MDLPSSTRMHNPALKPSRLFCLQLTGLFLKLATIAKLSLLRQVRISKRYQHLPNIFIFRVAHKHSCMAAEFT